MSATAEELLEKLKEMSDEHLRLGELRTQKWKESHDAEYGTALYHHLTQEIYHLDEKMNTLFTEMLQVGRQVNEAERTEDNRFKRPNKGFFSLFMKPLPVLDKNLQRIHTQDNQFDKIKTSKSLAIACYLVVILSVLGLVWALPWLRYSPLSLLLSFIPTGDIAQIEALYDNIPILAAGMFVLYICISDRKGIKTFIRKAALHEEQLFRRGAEHWTWPQRVYSCIAFGGAHVFNLFVPFGVVLCLCGMGAILMWVYLREYRSSNDERRATIAATQIHATYNRIVVLVAVVMITTIMVYTYVLLCLSLMS